MYEAVTSVRCGKTYRPGQSIPDGALSDRDLKILLELGSIKALLELGTEQERLPVQESSEDTSEVQTPPPHSGEITSSEAILDYVNSADAATLEKIKGVGKTTAKAIASHGTFATLDDLKELVPNVDWDSIQIND